MTELVLIMLLAMHAKQTALFAEINCGFLDQDNGLYLINSYYHYKVNKTEYFERTHNIANCEITKERYIQLRRS